MKNYILTDTGFWIGLIDPTDQYRENAETISELIVNDNIVFPWPCLYETLRTKYCKRKDLIVILEKIIKKSNITIFDDSKYRETALIRTIDDIIMNKSYRSLVDNVIREILSDDNVRINYLITFNKRDFIDICLKRKIDILP